MCLSNSTVRLFVHISSYMPMCSHSSGMEEELVGKMVSFALSSSFKNVV